MTKCVPVNKLELLKILQSLARPIVLTKNKIPSAAKNFRNDPSSKKRWLDGNWSNKPRQVKIDCDYAAHFIEREKKLWLGKYSGVVQDSNNEKYSIIIEDPTCYEIVDFDKPNHIVDHELLANFLKKSGGVIYTYFPIEPEIQFKVEVEKLLSNGKLLKPKGNVKPSISTIKVKRYSRDAAVEAWVLQNAEGKCECCGRAAPFNKDGSKLPYLEVHHVLRLADNGPDIPENAVAICPNCHRELHSGEKRKFVLEHLYNKISRLVAGQGQTV